MPQGRICLLAFSSSKRLPIFLGSCPLPSSKPAMALKSFLDCTSFTLAILPSSFTWRAFVITSWPPGKYRIIYFRQGHQINNLNFICIPNFPLPCNTIYSWVAGCRMWKSCEEEEEVERTPFCPPQHYLYSIKFSFQYSMFEKSSQCEGMEVNQNTEWKRISEHTGDAKNKRQLQKASTIIKKTNML